MTTVCYGSILLGQFGGVIVALATRSWPIAAGMCAVCFTVALALGGKVTEEIRAEHAAWMASWSEEAASKIWFGRFFDAIGAMNRGGRSDPRFFSPLAARVVEASLKTMPRLGYFQRVRVRYYVGRLEELARSDEERVQAEAIRRAAPG